MRRRRRPAPKWAGSPVCNESPTESRTAPPASTGPQSTFCTSGMHQSGMHLGIADASHPPASNCCRFKTYSANRGRKDLHVAPWKSSRPPRYQPHRRSARPAGIRLEGMSMKHVRAVSIAFLLCASAGQALAQDSVPAAPPSRGGTVHRAAEQGGLGVQLRRGPGHVRLLQFPLHQLATRPLGRPERQLGGELREAGRLRHLRPGEGRALRQGQRGR